MGNSLKALSTYKDSLSAVKDLTASVQSIVTILAIIVGGIWAYRRFVKTRQNALAIKVTHDITRYTVNNEGKALLLIDIVASNIGRVLFKISCLRVYIRQLQGEEWITLHEYSYPLGDRDYLLEP